jgi:hypothetical protein
MNNAQREMLEASVRQRLLLEQRVGPLELHDGGWSPDTKALMDILYGLSTVIRSAPIQMMIRGFLQREIAAIAENTPLTRLTAMEWASLIDDFTTDAGYGSMEFQLRSALRPLKEIEASTTFQRRMDVASGSGALSGQGPAPDSGAAEAQSPAGGAPGQAASEIARQILHTKETTVTLAGSILFLIYTMESPVADAVINSHGTSKPEESGRVKSALASMVEPNYAKVVKGLIKEIESRSDVRTKGVAYSALGQIGEMTEDVLEALTGCLSSEDMQDCWNAAWAVARNAVGEPEQAARVSGPPAAVAPELLSALERAAIDRIPRVACNAALALGGLGPAARRVSPMMERQAANPDLASTFELALDCIHERDGSARARLAERIGRADPILNIGLKLEQRDFGGFGRRGGGGLCMCTFS